MLNVRAAATNTGKSLEQILAVQFAMQVNLHCTVQYAMVDSKSNVQCRQWPVTWPLVSALCTLPNEVCGEINVVHSMCQMLHALLHSAKFYMHHCTVTNAVHNRLTWR